MAGPFKMKGSPMARNFGIGSPLHKDKGTLKTTTDEGGNKSKVYVSKNEKKAFVSSEGGNVIEKKKDGGIFRPNTTKSKKVNLTTGQTTVTKENIKTGKKTITTRKSNKKDNRIVTKGRKKTSNTENNSSKNNSSKSKKPIVSSNYSDTMRKAGISPMKQDILGPEGKRLVSTVKKGVKKGVKKVTEFVKGFTDEEITKRRNQRFRDYVKKSNKNPKKYPPKSSDEVY